MLIYKLIGGGSILISGIIFYLEMQKYELSKLEQVNGYISLIEHIKNQIECFLLPIDVIIAKCDKRILQSCGLDEKSPPAKMEELKENVKFYIDAEAIEIIDKFIVDFGGKYKKEQLNSCEYYRNELIKYRDKMKGKMAQDKRVRLALCLCISMSIVLLLI